MRKRNDVFVTRPSHYGAFDGYWFIHDFSTHSPYLYKAEGNGEEYTSGELCRPNYSEDDGSAAGAEC